ncbi:unnamed protein product, partial [Anisakis simplex]|uniref:FH2 domain-containing protein n=1 Tax=Anisakis simplex TaxID=6269 RepID=A0A0M3K9Y7_ANISI
IGRSEVLLSSDVLLAIASSQYFHYAKCKVLCLEILSGICLINDGHEKVLRALSEASVILGERTRFQTILNDLHRNYRSERETERVRTAAMSLINALLSTGSAENSLEVRMHLRVEMLTLGLQGVLDSMRDSSSSTLSDHIDFFEMSRQDDEQNFLRDESRSSTPIDLDSASEIAEYIANRLASTLALPHFLSMLQHLIHIPVDEKSIHIWRLFDMILQHLSLQTTLNAVVAADLTQSVVQIDMDEVLSRLRTQHDYDKLKEAHDDLEEELRRERNNSLELQTRLSDPDGQSLYSRMARRFILLECFRLSGESFSPSDPSHSPRSLSLPPICPPIGAPPPPPPPTLDQLRTFGDGHATSRRGAQCTLKKNVPKPSGPMKSLNWTAIADDKIAGTIWEKIDEEKLYQQLDLAELSENFSMAKGVVEEAESVSETLRRRSKASSASAISVIEPRRAQNCTIMLSKLRLSNKQIKKALLSMDQYDELPRDMLEQMLKFVPTKEEIARLRETVQKYGGSSSILAIADRFLYEVSNISRYEQRLRCLFILTTFKERLDDVSTNIQAISNASTSVAGSKRFKSLLRLILAVGNYLNYGKRNGNASGLLC